MEVELLDLEVSGDGAVIEVMRLIDVKDLTEPTRLLIREWTDERPYREVEVADDF